MRILEFEAKAILNAQGIPVPKGKVVTAPEDAAVVVEKLSRPVVVKAQIPMGGRMKMGGIRFADTPTEAVVVTGDLLSRRIHSFSVNHILIEEKLDIVAEVFVGATYDAKARSAVLLASTNGGVDIEVNTGEIVRRPFSSLTLIPDYLGREVASDLGFSGRQLVQLGEIITRIAKCFIQWDALLLEINPLALDTDDCWWIADVHLELDDDANYRQGKLLDQLRQSTQLSTPQSEFARRAAEIDSASHRGVAGRLIPFGGNLGLLIGGGGASLAIFDAVLAAGLKPANYCEIGGNPSVWKVKELTKLILSQPQVERLAVIMNVVSNSRVDLIARGVIKGILELERDPRRVIALFRVPGAWEEEGQAILRYYGVPFFGRETSIDQAVEALMAL